jgi:hypothetical protein
LITTLADGKETQPDAFVTVKAYVPVASPVTDMLVPVPDIAPGFIVQLPEGSPFKITLPVATEQLGCVVAPNAGAAGVPGFATITMPVDGKEIHPTEFVTVYEYVPATKPVMVLPDPVPVMAPGFMVQVPAGRSLKVTLPVAISHVGCIIALTVGAEGVTGCGLITTFAEATEVQPAAFVTVKL